MGQDHLQIFYLYGVAFLVGILNMFFDIAYGAFLPSIIESEQLVEGNSKLEVSNTIAQIAGPSLAGGLIQVLTAPLAIAVDAFSFLCRLLGRVSSSLGFIGLGTIPVGAFLGGILGNSLGLRPSLLLAGLFRLVFLWLFLSPIRTIREISPLAEEE